MQKIAASLFAAVALHGCGEEKPKQTTAIRGAEGVSSSDLEALKTKAKKKAQQFVKTAHLNAVVTQGFQAMKKSGISADQLQTNTEDLKKWAVKAQNEIVKNEKQVEHLIPEYQAQVLTYLKGNQADDFVKKMDSYTQSISAKDMEKEAETMLKDTNMFNAEQLMSFNNFIKTTIHSVQGSFGNNPLSSKAVKDLTKQINDAQHVAVDKFEKAPLKTYLNNAIDYEKKIYNDLPYEKISKGTKQFKNNLTEANVEKELNSAQKNLAKALA
jgi:gas vesicle protein